ncbi:MAG: hypothetical protein ACI9Y1_002943, partial [Lentisphaeria bacterium]
LTQCFHWQAVRLRKSNNLPLINFKLFNSVATYANETSP